MSLKPPKHSEMKWPDKRQGKTRKISLDYNLIVTEGTKTEYGEYRKNREDMFDILLPNLDIAIENAVKLSDEHKGRTPADSAPCTKMYELMQKFKPYLIY